MKSPVAAVLAVLLTTNAMAQSAAVPAPAPANPKASPPSDQRAGGLAPVGHRQPRGSDATASNSIEKVNPEDAALDRMLRGICRGC